MTAQADLERVAEEQAALRRVATLVAAGADEGELAAAVTAEIGRLFAAQRASTLRWDGATIRVIGDWNAETDEAEESDRVLEFGGDTISARVVDTRAPARLNSAAELRTEFARRRWAELGLEASIGAPIVVDGTVWGIVTASRTQPDDPFPPGAEHQLRDFAALVAQSIVNAEARHETAQLVAEQSSLRDVATLVAGGRHHAEVLDAVTSAAGALFCADTVTLVRWEGVQDEVVVVASWSAPGAATVEPGSLYHPGAGSATLTVLETGIATRAEEVSPERGRCSVIAAPVITKALLLGALTASRSDLFPAGAEIRLRSFADLAAQSIANDRAQAELRASRARIVRAADETRQRLERNLHDGAQQRLVSLSLSLRLVESKLTSDPERARELLAEANAELALALAELRELARGIHPAILTTRGLGPALQTLAERSSVPVELQLQVDERLPEAVEAAVFYVVSEALANVAKYAHATSTLVRVARDGQHVLVAVADDGIGGADPSLGSGLRGLADRIAALDGTFEIKSDAGLGTTVRAVVPAEQAVVRSS